MHPRKKVTLVIALLAPILLVTFVVASIYIPQLFTKPSENFMYFIGDDYSCSDHYTVKDKKVTTNQTSLNSSSGKAYQACIIRDLNDGQIKEIDANYVPANNHCLDEKYLTPEDQAALQKERQRWASEPEPCYVRNSYPGYDNIGRVGRYQLTQGEHCLKTEELSNYECFVSGPANKVKKVELSSLDIGYFCLPSQNLTTEQRTEARDAYNNGTDPFSTTSSYCKKTDLYIYDVKTNQSVKLTLQQAQQYNLNSSAKSPKGYEVARGSPSYIGFPFGGYSDNYKKYFLKGNGIAKKLNINYTDNGFKADYFGFLGWVE